MYSFGSLILVCQLLLFSVYVCGEAKANIHIDFWFVVINNLIAVCIFCIQSLLCRLVSEYLWWFNQEFVNEHAQVLRHVDRKCVDP